MFVSLLGFILSGCGFFSLSPYDAQAYQYLAKMEAQHFQVIDDFTVDPHDENAAPPTLQTVKDECREATLVFREANAYVSGRQHKDIPRETAFQLLTTAFKGDCDDLMDRAKTHDKFPTPTAAQELKQQHADNYAFAMRGEWARVKGK